MEQKACWLNFDLSFNSDVRGLYTWLDKMNAVFCASDTAFFKVDSFNGDLPDFILNEIKTNCKLSESDTLYLIYLDSASLKMKGKYLSGGRKQAPWSGYFTATSTKVDE